MGKRAWRFSILTVGSWLAATPVWAGGGGGGGGTQAVGVPLSPILVLVPLGILVLLGWARRR